MLRHKTYQCKVNYFGGEECKIILALHPGDFMELKNYYNRIIELFEQRQIIY
jgi:effector-binding domain-containing protein